MIFFAVAAYFCCIYHWLRGLRCAPRVCELKCAQNFIFYDFWMKEYGHLLQYKQRDSSECPLAYTHRHTYIHAYMYGMINCQHFFSRLICFHFFDPQLIQPFFSAFYSIEFARLACNFSFSFGVFIFSPHSSRWLWLYIGVQCSALCLKSGKDFGICKACNQ